LQLYELNDEEISLAIVEEDTGTVHDLTDASLELFIKPSADTPDSDPSVVILSSVGPGAPIDITDPPGGLATAYIDRILLGTPGDLVYRVDVVRPGARRTCVYGPLRVVNL
jgi:hypothetical protein